MRLRKLILFILPMVILTGVGFASNGQTQKEQMIFTPYDGEFNIEVIAGAIEKSFINNEQKGNFEIVISGKESNEIAKALIEDYGFTNISVEDSNCLLNFEIKTVIKICNESASHLDTGTGMFAIKTENPEKPDKKWIPNIDLNFKGAKNESLYSCGYVDLIRKKWVHSGKAV